MVACKRAVELPRTRASKVGAHPVVMNVNDTAVRRADGLISANLDNTASLYTDATDVAFGGSTMQRCCGRFATATAVLLLLVNLAAAAPTPAPAVLLPLLPPAAAALRTDGSLALESP